MIEPRVDGSGLSPRLTGLWQHAQLLPQAVQRLTDGPEDSARGQVRLQGHAGPVFGLRGGGHGGKHLQEVRNISGPFHTNLGISETKLLWLLITK